MKAPIFSVFSFVTALIFSAFQMHPLQGMEEKEEGTFPSRGLRIIPHEPGQSTSLLKQQVQSLEQKLDSALHRINTLESERDRIKILQRELYKEEIESLDFKIKKLSNYLEELEQYSLTFQEAYKVSKKLREDKPPFSGKKLTEWDEILTSLETKMISQMVVTMEIETKKAIISRYLPKSDSEKSHSQSGIYSKSDISDLKEEIFQKLMTASFRKNMPYYCSAHEVLCHFLREEMCRNMTRYKDLYGTPHYLSNESEEGLS